MARTSKIDTPPEKAFWRIWMWLGWKIYRYWWVPTIIGGGAGGYGLWRLFA